MRTLWRLVRATEWKIVPHAHRRHAPTAPCRTRHVGLQKHLDPAGTSVSPFRYQSTSVLGRSAWLRGNLLCFAWLHHLGSLHSGEGDHESTEDSPGTSICRLGRCSLSLRVPCFRVGPALQRQADRTRMSEASPKQNRNFVGTTGVIERTPELADSLPLVSSFIVDLISRGSQGKRGARVHLVPRAPCRWRAARTSWAGLVGPRRARDSNPRCNHGRGALSSVGRTASGSTGSDRLSQLCRQHFEVP